MAEDGHFELPSLVSFTKAYHHEPYPAISPQRPELSAEGKNVVVAGGGTGIGKAISIAFVQAGAASVAILGRRVDRLEEAAKEINEAGNHKSKVLTQGTDFSNLTEASAGLNKISNKVGKIDVFIWCAGILPTVASLSKYNPAEFRRAVDINLIGAFNAIQAIVPVAAPDLKLFNISSGIGHMKPIAGVGAYALTKAATAKLFDYVASENPQFRMVNIQPGVIASELNSENGIESEDESELPAHFCVWLASPEASFLSGKYVWANWDVEELMARQDEIKVSMLLRILLEGVPM